MSKRTYVSLTAKGMAKTWAFGSLVPYEESLTSSEEQYSLSNGRPPYNGRGGPWILEKNLVTGSPGYFSDDGFQGEYFPWYVLGYSSPPDTPVTSNHGELERLGTSAIAKVEPTKSAFDASTALGEVLKDGLPRIPGAEMRESVKLARSAGSEYLNYEFGWKPLVSDLKKFYKAVTHASEIASSYRKGANRIQQRRFDFPTKTTANSSAQATVICKPSKGEFASGTVNEEHFQRQWFIGNFIYYLPIGDDQFSQLRRFSSYAGKAFGVRLTPETVWNLAPWSWAADWFGNMGDVIHNASAIGTDGLVLRDGWMMEHTMSRQTIVATFPQNGPNVPTAGSIRYTFEKKVRIPSTPYGFGIDVNALSGRQTAIVAALGLSHQGKF